MDQVDTPSAIAPILFRSLRRMDAEATRCLPSGRPAGLCDFGYHARPELKRPQNEVEWRTRLAVDLESAGLRVEQERKYPGIGLERNRCDLVVHLARGKSLWIELKGSWRGYWGGNNKTYRTYLLHPLVPDLDAQKSHTVPFDLVKLGRLARPHATYIAELLVSFERFNDPIGDEVETLVRLSGLHTWAEHSDVWDSPTVESLRVRAWFWWTAIAAAPSPTCVDSESEQ